MPFGAIRAIALVGVNFPFILHKKSYFLYFTHQFLQNTHINLSIMHIYLIKYSLFYNFLLFSPSLPPSLRPHLFNIKARNQMASTEPEHEHKEEEEAPTNEDKDTRAHVAPIVKLEEIAVTTGKVDETSILDLYVSLSSLSLSLSLFLWFSYGFSSRSD